MFCLFRDAGRPDELRDVIAQALDAEEWKNGIEVVSALPNWISLRVACRRITADRLTRFVTELAAGVPEPRPQRSRDRVSRGAAQRDGARRRLRSRKVIEVAAVRTQRTIVYYFKDPGPGFNPQAPGLVATERRSPVAPGVP